MCSWGRRNCNNIALEGFAINDPDMAGTRVGLSLALQVLGIRAAVWRARQLTVNDLT
jgi:hypothetical protein